MNVIDMTGGAPPLINCCAVILAAGQSSRMGSPKQLLKYRGKTLLQNAIDAAKGANVQTVLVITGANAEQMLQQTDVDGVHVAENKNWQTGMASSIVSAMAALECIAPSTDAVLLMVCDQPFVHSSLLDEMINIQQNNGKLIVASRYGHTLGVPALFHRSLFGELSSLQGDQGGRKLIQLYRDNVMAVDFPEGSVDIDTMTDYQQLK